MLLAGLVLLNLAVIGGVTAVVYAHAYSEAHARLRDDLSLRAKTFAGLLEIDHDGLEFELSARAMPEYMKFNSGSYAAIYDAQGEPFIRSESLGRKRQLPTTEWSEGEFAYREFATGPDGKPVAIVIHSFVARIEESSLTEKLPDGSAWTPPSLENRRYQVVIAADSGPRDASLRGFLVFLLLTGAAALGATVFGGLVVARYVMAPIRRMTAEAAELTPSETSRRLQPETVVRELSSLSQTLNSALDRLGDALDRQRRFVSDASHELRTPLAVLLANAELLLRRERSGPEYRTGLERQTRIARRMTRITENLLALARADDGRAPMERTRLPLADVARRVLDEHEPMAAENGVALVCEADDTVLVEGDPTYLGQLLQNLLANAVKFTPGGGAVTVRVMRDGDEAVMEVSDTGPGIPHEHRARVFERFYRVNEGKDRREGAGLGLSIVAWIARTHGGHVSVRSGVGGGATFVVRLPLVHAPAVAVKTEA